MTALASRLPHRGPPGRAGVAANVLLWQLGWFSCVLGAAQGLGLAGAAIGMAIVLGHVATAARPARDAGLAGCALALGIALDTYLLHAGWVIYADPGPLAALPPAWLLVLWPLFAITLNRSLRWLRDRTGVAALFGAIGGPLSYLGAERLGAVQLPAPVAALLILAFAWAAVTPLLLVLARRLDGVAPR